MQKTKAKLPVLIISIAVIGACFLRFLQLLRIPSVNQETIEEYTTVSYALYAILVLVLVAGVTVAMHHPVVCRLGVKGRASSFLFTFAAIGLFVDFVNQGYNCFDYIMNSRYIEYSYIIPLALSGVLAIVSSFYLLCIASSSKGRNIDLKNFNILHFSVIIYGIVKLVVLTTSLMDVRFDINLLLEFIFLVFTVLLWFCSISSIDRSSRIISVAFVVCSIMSFAVSVIYFVPEFLCFPFRSSYIPLQSVATAFTYLTVGGSALAMLYDSRKYIDKE